MEREELQSAVFDFVYLEDPSPDRTGVHVIPYGDVFIALETRHSHAPRYLGWFCVTERPGHLNGWAYLGQFGQCHLYQNEADFREPSNDAGGVVQVEEVSDSADVEQPELRDRNAGPAPLRLAKFD
jgi:hypothetical protein